MRSVLAIFAHNKARTTELLLSSFFINILGLVSTVYVIQVLGRYIGYGVSGTLVTLSLGAVVAILFEYVFREIRHKIAQKVTYDSNEKIVLQSYNHLMVAKNDALERLSPALRGDLVGNIAKIRQAFNAQNFVSFLDIPFALIFIFALYLLSPILALIVTVFLLGLVAFILVLYRLNRTPEEVSLAHSMKANALVASAMKNDTVRAFNTGTFLLRQWERLQGKIVVEQDKIGTLNARIQTIVRSVQSFMSIVVVGVGAVLSVNGDLSIGAMIGANILAARALQPISRIAVVSEIFFKAKLALDQLEEIQKLPIEQSGTFAPTQVRGELEFQDVGFAYPNATQPIFESLSVKIPKGTVVAVCGINGAGKTTFAKMLCGLYQPNRGQLMFDGVDLRQYRHDWWRQQVLYFPQEPTFISGSMRENITILKPDITEEKLTEVIAQAALNKFLNQRAEGLDSHLPNGGEKLPVGIRRRLALARGLVSNQVVALFDEPFVGLDSEGVHAVQSTIQRLKDAKRTVFIFTHEAEAVNGVDMVINLNQKPAPSLSYAEHLRGQS